MDSLLALLLRFAIDAGRCALLVGATRRVVRLLAEYIIGRYLHEPTTHFLHGASQVLGGCRIELLDERTILGSLGCIDVSPRGTVYDGADVVLLDHRADGVEVGDVEERGLHAFLLSDVGEDVMVRRVLSHDAHLVAQLSVRSCDEYIHFLSYTIFCVQS